MDWKPNKFIAALLGFYLQPVAMLYVARPGLAAVYLILAPIAAIADLFQVFSGVEWGRFLLFSFAYMLVCAAHAYLIASDFQSDSVRPWYSRWYGLASVLTLMFVSTLFFRAFLYEPFSVPGQSMSPSINQGDYLLASKWGYGNYGSYGISLDKPGPTKKILRGDLIVYEYPKDPSVSYVKRVIGLPGDEILYDRNGLAINGVDVKRDFVDSGVGYVVHDETIDGVSFGIMTTPSRPAIEGRFTVPEGQLFVLGDNRDNSNDSRYWGGVPLENIVGKVVYVFSQDDV